jgi:transcriptional regulator with XRE-family HTH domain
VCYHPAMVTGMGTTRLGKRIRELREAAHLSLRELAVRSNISHSYLSKLETGRRANCSVDVVRVIAKALDYPLEALLREGGILPPETDDGDRDALIIAALEAAEQLPPDVRRSEAEKLRILAEHYRQLGLSRRRGGASQQSDGE